MRFRLAVKRVELSPALSRRKDFELPTNPKTLFTQVDGRRTNRRPSFAPLCAAASAPHQSSSRLFPTMISSMT